jgi:hypothetical protein
LFPLVALFLERLCSGVSPRMSMLKKGEAGLVGEAGLASRQKKKTRH